MFCKNCGAQLREGARFCSSCGKAVEEYNHSDAPENESLGYTDEEKAAAQAKFEYVFGKNLATDHESYEGWHLANNLFGVSPVEINMPGAMIDAMMDGKIEFVCLTPPTVVMGSNFIQASMCENGTIHFEVSLATEDGGYQIYAIDDVDAADACNYMKVFLSKGILPGGPKPWYRI